MKRTIKLAVVAALALGATSAFATNGSTLIGIGAKSRGMGGVGIATGMGAESGINNPALITSIKGDNEVSFGGTVFMPDIEVNNDMSNFGNSGSTAESESDMFVIPAVSLASKVNDNFYWGIGMWGTGGLGVDYRDETLTGTTFQMVTALQTMQFGIPMAYTTNGFSLGITPIIQYSSLDIDYDSTAAGGGSRGAGVSQDLAYGLNLGMAYEISGLTIGAVYKSEIKFSVDDVVNNAIQGFGLNYNQDEMATPEEYGIGLSYSISGHTIAVDWRYINWEDAEVYQDFGWEDQDVIAVGYEYATNEWAVRCGYQYAESAVEDNSGKNLALDAQMPGITNTFNMLGFPGTQEEHITLGGSYAFNETLSIDLAAVYGLENEEEYTNFTGNTIKTTHSEESYSVQINYAF
jgi:long-chain fatty acid transport protein